MDELQELIQCPREYFTLEIIRSDYIKEGEIVSGPPVVEFYWFDRGQVVQDQAARIITSRNAIYGRKHPFVIFKLE